MALGGLGDVLLGSLLLRLAIDNSEFQSGLHESAGALGEFHESLAKFGENALKTGAEMSEMFTAPLVEMGKEALNTAAAFETSMSKIAGLTSSTTEQLAEMKDGIEGMHDLPQTATELADGLYYIASAGFKGAEGVQVLHTAAMASAAGLGQTKVVADALTSALNAYGMGADQATHLTDVMVAAITQGKMAPEALAGALGRVLPVAAAMGVSFEEVTANIATMTNVGLSADEATTALRGVLLSLEKPGKQASDTMAQFGMSAQGLRDEIREKGLLATLQDMMDKTGGNEAALAKIFPNVRALVDVLGTVKAQGDAYVANQEEITNSEGRLAKAFEAAAGTFAFQSGEFGKAVEEIKMSIGQGLLPVATQLTQWATAELPQAFETAKGAWEGLGEPVQHAILAFGGVLAAAGPVVAVIGLMATTLAMLISPIGLVVLAVAGLAAGVMLVKDDMEAWSVPLSILGGALAGITVIIAAIEGPALALAAATAAGTLATQGLTVAMGLLNAVMLLNPVVLVTAAVVGLTAAMVILYNTNAGFRDSVNAVWDGIKNIIANDIDFIGKMLEGLGEIFVGLPGPMHALGEAMITAGGAARNLADAIQPIPAIVGPLAAPLGALGEALTNLEANATDATPALDAFHAAVVDLASQATTPEEINAITKAVTDLTAGVDDGSVSIDDALGVVQKAFDDAVKSSEPMRAGADAVKGALDDLAAGATEDTPPLDDFSTAVDALAGKASTPEQLAAITDAVGQVASGVQDGSVTIDDAMATVSKAFDDATAAATAAVPGTTNLADALDALAQSAADGSPDMDTFKAATANLAASAASTPEELDAIQSAMDEVAKGVANGSLTVDQAISQMQTAFANASTSADPMQQKTNDLIKALDDLGAAAGDEGASQQIDQLKQTALNFQASGAMSPEQVDALTQAVGDLSEGVKTGAIDTDTAMGQVAAAFDTAHTDVNKSLEQMDSDVQGKLAAESGSWGAQAAALGRSIASGIAAGVGAAADTVGTAIHNLLAGAMARGQHDIDAHSPSQVFADIIGLPIAEGIAVGIAQGAQQATDAVTAMLDDVMQAGADAIEASSPSRRAARVHGLPIPQGTAEGIRQGTQVAKDAITGMMEQLVSSTTDYRAQFGQIGGDLASKMSLAIEENTAASGKAVATALDKMIDDIRKAGVDNWRELGDELAGAVHDALIERTPEAKEAALAEIQAMADVLTEANSPGGVWDKHLHDLATLDQLTSDLGKNGEKAGQALLDALTDPTKQHEDALWNAVQTLIQNAQNRGVPGMQELARQLDDALYTMFHADSEEAAQQAYQDAYALIGQIGHGIDAATPRAKTALDAFNAAMLKAATDSDLISQYGQLGANVINAFAEAVGPDGPNTNNAATAAANGLRKMIHEAEKLGIPDATDAGAAIQQALADAIASKDPDLIAAAEAAVKAYSDEITAAMDAASQGKIQTAIDKLNVSMTQAMGKVDLVTPFRTAMSDALEAANAVVDNETPQSVQKLSQMATDLVRAYREHLPPQEAAAAMDALLQAVDDVVNTHSPEAVAHLQDVLSQGLSEIANVVVPQKGQAITDKIMTMMAHLNDAFLTPAQKAMNDLKTAFEEGTDKAVTAVGPILDKLGPLVRSRLGTGSTAMAALTQFQHDAEAALREGGDKGYADFMDALTKLATDMGVPIETILRLLASVGTGARNMAADVANAARDVSQATIDAANSLAGLQVTPPSVPVPNPNYPGPPTGNTSSGTAPGGNGGGNVPGSNNIPSTPPNTPAFTVGGQPQPGSSSANPKQALGVTLNTMVTYYSPDGGSMTVLLSQYPTPPAGWSTTPPAAGGGSGNNNSYQYTPPTIPNYNPSILNATPPPGYVPMDGIPGMWYNPATGQAWRPGMPMPATAPGAGGVGAAGGVTAAATDAANAMEAFTSGIKAVTTAAAAAAGPNSPLANVATSLTLAGTPPPGGAGRTNFGGGNTGTDATPFNPNALLTELHQQQANQQALTNLIDTISQRIAITMGTFESGGTGAVRTNVGQQQQATADTIAAAMDQLKDWFLSVRPNLIDPLTQLPLLLGQELDKFPPNLRDELKTSFNVWTSNLDPLLFRPMAQVQQGLIQQIEQSWSTMADPLHDLPIKLAQTFGSLPPDIRDNLTQFTNQWMEANRPFLDAQTAFTQMGPQFASVLQQAGAAFLQGGTTAYDAFVNHLDPSVQTMLGGLLNWLSSTLPTLTDPVTQLPGAIAQVLAPFPASISGPLTTFLEGMSGYAPQMDALATSLTNSQSVMQQLALAAEGMNTNGGPVGEFATVLSQTLQNNPFDPWAQAMEHEIATGDFASLASTLALLIQEDPLSPLAQSLQGLINQIPAMAGALNNAAAALAAQSTHLVNPQVPLPSAGAQLPPNVINILDSIAEAAVTNGETAEQLSALIGTLPQSLQQYGMQLVGQIQSIANSGPGAAATLAAMQNGAIFQSMNPFLAGGSSSGIAGFATSFESLLINIRNAMSGGAEGPTGSQLPALGAMASDTLKRFSDYVTKLEDKTSSLEDIGKALDVLPTNVQSMAAQLGAALKTANDPNTWAAVYAFLAGGPAAGMAGIAGNVSDLAIQLRNASLPSTTTPTTGGGGSFIPSTPSTPTGPTPPSLGGTTLPGANPLPTDLVMTLRDALVGLTTPGNTLEQTAALLASVPTNLQSATQQLASALTANGSILDSQTLGILSDFLAGDTTTSSLSNLTTAIANATIALRNAYVPPTPVPLGGTVLPGTTALPGDVLSKLTTAIQTLLTPGSTLDQMATAVHALPTNLQSSATQLATMLKTFDPAVWAQIATFLGGGPASGLDSLMTTLANLVINLRNAYQPPPSAAPPPTGGTVLPSTSSLTAAQLALVEAAVRQILTPGSSLEQIAAAVTMLPQNLQGPTQTLASALKAFDQPTWDKIATFLSGGTTGSLADVLTTIANAAIQLRNVVPSTTPPTPPVTTPTTPVPVTLIPATLDTVIAHLDPLHLDLQSVIVSLSNVLHEITKVWTVLETGFTAIGRGLGVAVSFAAGGIVSGKTLAMLGDNPSGIEAAVPLEKWGAFAAAAGGGHGGVPDIHVHLEHSVNFGMSDVTAMVKNAVKDGIQEGAFYQYGIRPA